MTKDNAFAVLENGQQLNTKKDAIDYKIQILYQFDILRARLKHAVNMKGDKNGMTGYSIRNPKKGIGVIGCGTDLDDSAKPLYLEEAGGIGLIGVGYQPTCTPATETTPGCFPWDDFERIERSIKEIKKEISNLSVRFRQRIH